MLFGIHLNYYFLRSVDIFVVETMLLNSYFFKEISKRLIETSGNQRTGFSLGQRISLVKQRDNAASLLGTLPIDSHLEGIYLL